MKTKRRNKKNEKSGRPFSGNADAFIAVVSPMQKQLMKGLPVNVSDIVDYRDAIKHISAQVLYKGISGVNCSTAKNMNYYTIFKNTMDKDLFNEIKSFYDCFNKLYHNTTQRRFKADLKKYQVKGKDSISHAIADIEYVLDNYLDKAYVKLNNDYIRYGISNKEVYNAIKKLQDCSYALRTICDVNKFLYKRVIPKTISNKDYNELEKRNCQISKFYYKDAQDHCIRKKKTYYIDLGEEGFSYFIQKLV